MVSELSFIILYVANFPMRFLNIVLTIFNSLANANCRRSSLFSSIPDVKLDIGDGLSCIVCFPINSSSVSVVGYISLALKSPAMYVGPLFLVCHTCFVSFRTLFLSFRLGLWLLACNLL